MRYILLFVCLALASCITPAKFQEWAQRHPDESARICSDLYPVRSEYVKGTDSVRYEAVQLTVPGGMVGLFLPVSPMGNPVDTPMSTTDTARAGVLTLTWQKVAGGYAIKCRADSLQLLLDSAREIHLRVDTRLQENTAHVRALQGDSARLVQQVSKATTRGDALQKWALYAAGGLVLLLGWTFRISILGLVKKLIS